MPISKVSVGVACSSWQQPRWWQNLVTGLLVSRNLDIEITSVLLSSTAVPDHNKNYLITNSPWNPEEKKRSDLTDANRVNIVSRFLEGTADWLYWIDDDTVHPQGTLYKLLKLKREAVSGLYFMSKPPHNPIAYHRRESGLYGAYYHFTRGAVEQVDSVGMGCCLVHRSVFEKIMDTHIVCQRPNGSFVAVYKDDMVVDPDFTYEPTNVQVINNVMLTPLTQLKPDDDYPEDRAFPFFAMEYGRTEDHHFWEMAEKVGVKPWVDTTIICKHLKQYAYSDDDYLRYIAEKQAEYFGEQEYEEIKRGEW